MLNFIVNPNAGGARGYGCWKKLESSLLQKKREYQLFLTGGPGEARELSRRITGREGESGQILVVVGGEGTMNEVLDGARLSASPVFGFIPVGRRSELAKRLGLPRGASACLNRVLFPRALKFMEYGVVSYEDQEPKHRRFLVRSGSGFGALALDKRRSAALRDRWRHPLLCRAEQRLLLLGAARRSRASGALLILDGERKLECSRFFLLSAELPGAEGRRELSAPSAELRLRLLHSCSGLKLLRALLTPDWCETGEIPGCRNYSCTELKVMLEEEQPLHVDGEPCGSRKEFTVRCVRQKLRFLC